MHKNPTWILFLILICSSSLGYTGYTIYKIFRNKQLTEQVPLESIQWSVHQINQEKYVPQADYTFSFKDKQYKGSVLWDEHFLNAQVAQEVIDKFSAYHWKAWINPNNPEQSAIQKKFPYKETISAVILWTITVYFFTLGIKITRY